MHHPRRDPVISEPYTAYTLDLAAQHTVERLLLDHRACHILVCASYSGAHEDCFYLNERTCDTAGAHLQRSVCNDAVTGLLEGATGHSQRKLQHWFTGGSDKDAVGSNITGALG